MGRLSWRLWACEAHSRQDRQLTKLIPDLRRVYIGDAEIDTPVNAQPQVERDADCVAVNHALSATTIMVKRPRFSVYL